MKKIMVLGTRAIILTPKEMLRKFGERSDYMIDPEKNTIYIDENLIIKEAQRYDGHMNEKEAAEDVYRRIRTKEEEKTIQEAIRDTIPRSRMKS